MKYFLSISIAILMMSRITYGQNDVQVGASLNQRLSTPQGAFYDYSDQGAVNIKVAVWGFVKFPGKYVIPSYSSINDLLSYAGGPTDAAKLEDMKLYRMNPDSSQVIIPLNYKDIIFNNKISTVPKSPEMKAGDVLLVTGEPRYYFRDQLSMGLSIVSTLISLAILIINIVRK